MLPNDPHPIGDSATGSVRQVRDAPVLSLAEASAFCLNSWCPVKGHSVPLFLGRPCRLDDSRKGIYQSGENHPQQSPHQVGESGGSLGQLVSWGGVTGTIHSHDSSTIRMAIAMGIVP